jgi:hypothetical protein
VSTEFFRLLLQPGISGVEFPAAPLILGQLHDSGQVSLGEPLYLLSKRSLRFP